MPDDDFKLRLNLIASTDVAGLVEAEKHYGDSWCRRGGRGAYFNLTRKWDRLERQVLRCDEDLFRALASDTRAEGIIDDIRDLRRYLLLVEEYASAHIAKYAEVKKGEVK